MEPAPPARSAPTVPWTGRLLTHVAVAVLSGLLMLVAFPPYGQWWAAPVAVAGIGWAVHGRRVRAGFGLGFLAGAAFFTPLLAWTNLHTGILPWLLLSGAEAVVLGLMGAALAWVSPLTDRWRWVGPVLTAVLWTGQEALRDRAPFGGFPWGRLAFSQTGSPLLRFAALGGAPFLTFVVALCGGLLLTLATGGLRVRRAAAVVGALAVLVVAGRLVPITPPAGRTVTVAVVQGNVPRLGLDFNAQRRAVLDNHVAATLQLAKDITAGTAEKPDLVIWPENSSDIDPLQNPDAAAEIDQAAATIGAPILVGAVLEDPKDNGVQNAGLVWTPGQGVTARYVKRHPVPFAEYIPMRKIARMVTTKVDLVATDFIAGHTPGVLRMGSTTVGDVICFEVAYDGIVRDTVTGGGQILAVQTNNATFDTDEAAQQLAMVRERAVEHGRDALMASTVGISAFADAHGDVYQATGFNTRAVIERRLHLGDGETLATRVGAWPEYVIVAAALAALIGVVGPRRRARSVRKETV